MDLVKSFLCGAFSADHFPRSLELLIVECTGQSNQVDWLRFFITGGGRLLLHPDCRR